MCVAGILPPVREMRRLGKGLDLYAGIKDPQLLAKLRASALARKQVKEAIARHQLNLSRIASGLEPLPALHGLGEDAAMYGTKHAAQITRKITVCTYV